MPFLYKVNTLLRPVATNKVAMFFCIAGFVFNLIAYYPGFLSYDSFVQYSQALTGQYSDWHPPIMAALWRLLDHLHPGPLPMLVFQLLCFWISCYLLMTIVRSRVWLVLMMLFSMAPFVQNFVGYIIKDSEMPLAWLLAGAIMFRALVANRRLSAVEAVVSMVFIIFASWVRHNAFPGSFPFCILWSWLVLKNNNRLYKIVVAVFVAVFLIFARGPFEQKILKATVTHTIMWPSLMDITGVYAQTGQNYFPAFLYSCPHFDTAYLRAKYTPATCTFLWSNEDGNDIICNVNDSTIKELMHSWIRAISEHPAAYLKNRAEGDLYFLRIKDSKSFFVYMYPWIDKNPYGFTHLETRVSKVFIQGIARQKDMPYMRPWFWLFLNIVLLFLFPFIKNNAYRFFYMVLVSSGLLYLLPQLLVFPTDTDFRYFYWNCICCSLAACLFIYDRYVFHRLEHPHAHKFV
jgi:hypothetical protein